MRRPSRDRGTILVLTMVIVIVLGAVVVALATYASSTLRYERVVEQSADRLATADGALDNVLEAIDRNASLCTLSPLPSQGGGYTFPLGDSINGIEPTVNCHSGGGITGVEEFAVILTGDAGTGARSGPLLQVEGSATPRKVIDGPVYMSAVPNEPSTITLNAPLTIQNGDVWYSNATCPGAVSVPLYPSPTGKDLLLTPAGYGFRCLDDGWSALFGAARPVEPAVTGFPSRSSTTPVADPSTGCYVWEPGRYAAPPTLANQSYNYFRSGDYYFENVGEWSIQNSSVLFGYPGPGGPGIPPRPSDPTNPCTSHWQTDSDQIGAAVYLGGTSRIRVGQNGALEVSGRQHGGQVVALQALEVQGVPSGIQGDDPSGPLPFPTRLINLDSGNQKQVSFHGLVWAPFGSVDLDNIANDAVAAFTGGAVLGELLFQTPQATNFVLSAGGTPAPRQLEITSTATSSDGGTTNARAIITYENGEYALESRRVMCITPGDPGSLC